MLTVDQLDPRLQASALILQETQRNLMAKADGQFPGFFEFFVDAIPQLLNEQILSYLMGVQAQANPVGLVTGVGAYNTSIERTVEARSRLIRTRMNVDVIENKSSETNADDVLKGYISDIANEFLGYVSLVTEYAHKCEDIQSAIVHIFAQTGLRPNTIVCSSVHPSPVAPEGITIKEFDLDFKEIFVTYVSETTAGIWYCPYTLLMCAGLVKKQDVDEPEMTLITRFGLSYIPEEINKFYCVI